ncbi:hypothetical protein NNC19_13350 [Clostridium sp. SHJSY1]|uniref:hypothetical protein n=1 Tax=Clostridium sp. SHJSY1 TaxID=2942483 RepID=UPI0028746B22|nr:hypothetical protein [Clostridium sp. SHJSY1]MDS0526672.1 hypothetical protein [Clostridium sp. SHJSY1]
MNEKIIKLKFIGDLEDVTFSTEEGSTFKINVFEMNNLKYWLQDKSSSIVISCEDGSELALNKYTIQYANIYK